MAIKTKKVQGRRNVRYESFDDLLNDAQQLTHENVRTLGNWSQGQIYEHIARALHSSIDGVGFTLPFALRWFMSTFMKRKFLREKIPAGFTTTEKFSPDDISAEEGLASLQKAIERQKHEPKRVRHPAFGNISREEWDSFQLRHAELHMSFLVKAED